MSDRERFLKKEIAEIEALIAQWEGHTDPETRWAICLLNHCLDNRRRDLRRFLRRLSLCEEQQAEEG